MLPQRLGEGTSRLSIDTKIIDADKQTLSITKK